MADPARTRARWRLLLGQFSQPGLGDCLGSCPGYSQMDQLLDFLYGREYQNRTTRPSGPPASQERSGSTTAAGLSLPDWLQQARTLFPQESLDVLQRDALDRYGLTELVTDPEVLETLEPDYDLLRLMLSYRHLMNAPVLEVARALIRRIVDQLRQRLEREVKQALTGANRSRRSSPLKVARNLDMSRTIRANLKHYDPERQALVLEHLHFCSRQRRHLPWHIVMAVDCSGSMLDSVIHSAVMAGILSALPAISVSLIAFDTRIVDLSGELDDPCEVLMKVQLGGGTFIGKALRYCEQRVEQPSRTVVILVTDFFEGDHPNTLLTSIARLRGAGVRVLGLGALDAEARPAIDRDLAERCREQGMEVASMTPGHLAEWLGAILG